LESVNAAGTVEDLEIATLSSISRHNHDRLHGYLADVPTSRVRASVLRCDSDDPELGICRSMGPLLSHDAGRYPRPPALEVVLELELL